MDSFSSLRGHSRPNAEIDIPHETRSARSGCDCCFGVRGARHLESKDMLGQPIRRNPEPFPTPAYQIDAKEWAYSSNFGRRLVEGAPPHFEAELTGTLCRFLARCACDPR